MQASTKKIKIFGGGNQELFITKGFSFLNCKEKPMHLQTPPFSKMTGNLHRCKRSNHFLCGNWHMYVENNKKVSENTIFSL